jgi:hypothetical protein
MKHNYISVHENLNEFAKSRSKNKKTMIRKPKIDSTDKWPEDDEDLIPDEDMELSDEDVISPDEVIIPEDDEIEIYEVDTLKYIKKELAKPEISRNNIKFKYENEYVKGIPMAILSNGDAILFKIISGLKKFTTSKIILL